MELGSHVRDRTAPFEDLFHGSLSSFNGQWGVTVVMERFLPADAHGFVTTHRAGQGPVPSPHRADYNVMTHNS